MTEHVRQIGRVVAVIFRNDELRRVQIAFAAFNGAEWAVWIAMLVYAYNQGGATTAGIVALVQLVPATVFAPFASILGDRYRPARILAIGYAAQAAGMGATAAVLLLDGPPVAAYACAAVAATAVTMTRPTMAALTPGLCRVPEELTATNVVSGWNESVSMLVAPAIAGILLAATSTGWVFLLMGTAVLGAALLVAPIAGPDASPSQASVRRELAEGFAVVVREPAARTLVGILGAEQIALGMLDLLYVVLAVGTLGMGDGGAGYLNAAFGAGGAIGIALTASLVGRARLVPAMFGALVIWGSSFAVMAVWTTPASAFVLLALVGVAHCLFDVAGKTLLQRTAPPDALARVFGVLEGLTMAGVALGSLLAPLLVHLGGATAALLGAGALLPLVALLNGKRLVALDASADVPVVEIGLLRSLRLFSALPPPALEGLARSLVPVSVAPGEAVVTQGEEGDRYYAIAEGQFEVIKDLDHVVTLGRGDGFGEIALLHDVVRTASVRSSSGGRVYALDKVPFLEVLTGHPATHAAAHSIAAERVTQGGASER